MQEFKYLEMFQSNTADITKFVIIFQCHNSISTKCQAQDVLRWQFWFIKGFIQYSEYLQLCTKDYRNAFCRLNSARDKNIQLTVFPTIKSSVLQYLHDCTSNVVQHLFPCFQCKS